MGLELGDQSWGTPGAQAPRGRCALAPMSSCWSSKGLREESEFAFLDNTAWLRSQLKELYYFFFFMMLA